ncbi:MAG: TMEM175 family protein [Gemmatimonadales bacterium]
MAEGTGRVDAFSDGVFAIAITLLILEIRVPHAGAGGGLWAGLVALWPSYLAFLLSFFVILIMWVNHHELMRLVRAVDYPFLFANGLVLLTVTFVPFPTAVLAEHLATGEARAAVTFYCGTFIINSLAWGLLFWVIVRGKLLRTDCDPETIARIRRAYTAGPLVYVVATVVALVQPVVGLALNAALWLLWIRLCYHTRLEATHTRHGTQR